MSSSAVRDASGCEKGFELTEQQPTCEGGQPLCVLVEREGARRFVSILDLTNSGQVVAHVQEMSLTHGQFDDAPYALGDTHVGGRRMRYVVVEKSGSPRQATVEFDPPL